MSDRQELRQEIFQLSVPAIGEMFLQLALMNADTIMLGQLGSAALAAAGFSRQFASITTIVLFAVAAGSTALVARYVGAKDYEAGTRVVNQSILLGIVLSAVIAGVGYLLAPNLLQLLGAKENVIQIGTGYLQLIFLSIFPTGIMIIANSILRAGGNTKSPMVVTAVINGVNILGNWLLIFGVWIFPQWELIGAGTATLLAKSIGALLAVSILANNQFGVKLKLTKILKLDLATMKEVLRIGIPAGFDKFAFKSGQMIMVKVIALLGTVAVATRQIALAIEGFSTLPNYGLSIAATTLVGQKLGADKEEEADQSSILANKFGVLTTLVLGGIFFVFPEQLADIYTDDPELIETAAVCLRVLAFAQPAKALNMIFGGTFRGAGDTKFPMYLTFIGVWGIALPLTYVLGVKLSLGLIGIWSAMVADEWFRAVVCIIRFKTEKWKQVEISDLS